ncbi:hypothetical protein OKW21_000889 [Catalinimonas alkaloidigena]|nr:hypothetical protein [Catalinimonas alkaloidigena]
MNKDYTKMLALHQRLQAKLNNFITAISKSAKK